MARSEEEGTTEGSSVGEPLADYQIDEVKREIADLKTFRDLAYRIKRNTKADKLFTALDRGFKTLKEIGANQKALIFTESKRTQDFLYSLLGGIGAPFEGEVVLFNGSNNDATSKKIYNDWLKNIRIPIELQVRLQQISGLLWSTIFAKRQP